jgi:hypothetical protein
MAIPGYVEYERREYCKAVQCPVQQLLDRQAPNSEGCEQVRGICTARCIHTTYEFHHWLIGKGYLIVRPGTQA